MRNKVAKNNRNKETYTKMIRKQRTRGINKHTNKKKGKKENKWNKQE